MITGTREGRALRESGAEFVRREVVPHLQAWEDAGQVPRELHVSAAKQGFLGLGVPEECGGSGGDFLDAVALAEAMTEVGASSGLLAALFTSGIALPHIIASRDDDLVYRFVRPTLAGEKIGALAVTEPDGGSDVTRISTTARRDGDHYFVNGAKTFITSGVRADFVTTAVRTGGPGHGGVSLRVIEKGATGFEGPRALLKTGWLCYDTAELSFDGCRAPVRNLISEENAGFAMIAAQFVNERLMLAVHGGVVLDRTGSLRVVQGDCIRQGTRGLRRTNRLAPGCRAPAGPVRGRHRARPVDDAEGRCVVRRRRRHRGRGGGEHGEVRRGRGGVHCRGPGGAGARRQRNHHGVRCGRVAGRHPAGRIAPVSREMILNFVGSHTLGLPKSY